MINLDGIKPFAEGGNRMCFVHPDNPGRCLKVVHPGLPSKIKNSKSWYKRFRSIESFDDNLRNKRHMIKKHSKKMIPIYGCILQGGME